MSMIESTMRAIRSNDLPEKCLRVIVLLGIGELVHAASVCEVSTLCKPLNGTTDQAQP